MCCSARVVAAVLVLTLCAAAAGTTFAVEKEPVSGGLLALPGSEAPAPTLAAPRDSSPPAVTPKEARKVEDDTSWGVLLRGGYFGLPNFIADELFNRHPEIAG